MRKKIIATILLIILLGQVIGNCSLAYVNSMLAENEIVNEESTINDEINDDVDNNEEFNNTLLNKSVEIGEQYITEDDLLYSNSYLIKDKIVSRIDPKTTISNFLQKIDISKGNEVKFYKNDGITPVTEGVIGTGMILKGTNGQEYKLSVKGDMTGDGEISQVELTMLIRHLIGLDGWDLSDINLVSGDINGDGDVNLVDVNKVIRHIVFKDMDYDNATTPNSPTIEIFGVEGEETDLYTSGVNIKIIEADSSNYLKNTYKISGKIEKDETGIEKNEEINLNEDGEYLITAYTYGIQGNRSKASNRTIVIKKVDSDEPTNPDPEPEPEPEPEPMTDVSYKVEHYLEKPDTTAGAIAGSSVYELEETENLTGKTGFTVTAIAKTYEGYTEDTANANRVETVSINF